MNSHQVIHGLAQENHEVKMKYNELLQNHQDLKKEMDLVKLPQVSLPQVEPQVESIQHEQYQNTIRFLQAKNAELSRVITTKPEKPPTKVVPGGSNQSFKIMADKHPMMDASHNVLSELTDSSNNLVKSRCFHPGFGYGYPGYLGGYGYPYPGYGHHYLD